LEIEMRERRSSHQYKLAYNSGRRRLRRMEQDGDVLTLVRRVASHRGVAVADILRVTRGNTAVVEARWLAMYLAHVNLGRDQEIVAMLFGRDRTTVAYACHLMEDRRDDSALEAEIGRIITGAARLRSQRRGNLLRRRPRHGA
jgi:chromosomal replication initiation ATPase DnaA